MNSMETIDATPEAQAVFEKQYDSNTAYQEAVNKLAKLQQFEYDRVRKEQAEALGVQIKTLDDSVKTSRNNENEAGTSPFADIEPHPESIDPAALLSEISNTIKRYIVLDDDQIRAISLWVTFTWFIDAVETAPIIILSSPERECGKTQLISIIEQLTCKPLTTSNMRGATLFRIAEKWHPTILIDEADTFIKTDEELAGLINAGHTRVSAIVWRLVGNNFEPKEFNVWGAKAFAGISLEKHLPNATISRSVVINLRRKLPNESVERLRHANQELFKELASKLARFSTDYSSQVKEARPTLPEELSDRSQDNWEPLLAIAQCAGEEWFKKSVSTAKKLSGVGGQSLGMNNELLSDIRDIFIKKGEDGTITRIDKISTMDLIHMLIEDQEKPWATYNKGNKISPAQIAKRLHGYEIKSKTIRMGHETVKGFEHSQFDDAFNRYLTDAKNSQLQSDNSMETNNDKGLNVTSGKNVVVTVTATAAAAAAAADKVTPKPMPPLGCDFVTEKEVVVGTHNKEQRTKNKTNYRI